MAQTQQIGGQIAHADGTIVWEGGLGFWDCFSAEIQNIEGWKRLQYVHAWQ